MNSSLEAIYTWLVSPQANWVTCGSIVAVAVYWGVLVRIRLRRVRLSVSEAASEIAALDSERAFSREFESLNDRLSGHRHLGHAWREFADSLLLPTDGSGVCRNTEPPENFFSADAVAGEAVNLRLVQAMPNVLTGLGILGTFLGLAAGISLGTEGMAGADVDIAKTKEALGKLLSGAGLAFATSICGLGASLLLSILDKRSLKSLDAVVDDWNRALDRCLKRATPEQLAADQLAEMKKQTFELGKFNTDLAVSIAEALDSRLSSALSQRFGEVVEELRGLRGQQSEFASDVLTKVSGELSTALSGAAGAEMSQTVNALGSLVGALNEAANTLSAGQRQMVQATDGLVASVQRAFSDSASKMNADTAQAVQLIVENLGAAGQATASHLVRAGEESSRQLGQAVGVMSAGVDGLSNLVGGFSQAAERQALLTTEVNGVLGAMKEVHLMMRAAAEPLATASKSLTSAGTTLSERLANLERVAAALLQVSENVRNAQAQFENAWRDHEKRFGDVDGALERAFRELNDGIDALGSRVRQYLVEVDQSLAKSVQSLSAVADQLVDGLDGLHDAKERSR